MNFELDNVICIILLGGIAVASLYAGENVNTTLASSVASGLIGYLAKTLKQK